MAHELNQPLTAVLANTQAAVRLLKESPPEIDTAQTAMQRATEQARRACAAQSSAPPRTPHAFACVCPRPCAKRCICWSRNVASIA